jgi:hypothetical protein
LKEKIDDKNILDGEVECDESSLERKESEGELEISGGHVGKLLQRKAGGIDGVKPPKSPVPHHEKESNGEHHKNHFGLLRPVRDSLEEGEGRCGRGGERERR